VLVHIAALAVIQLVFPVQWNPKTPPPLAVKIRRVHAQTEPATEAPLPSPDSRPIPSRPSTSQTERVVSLDAKNEKFHPYLKRVKQQLLTHWHYPPAARHNLIEGRAVVLFSLLRAGRLEESHLASSSGHASLDQEALQAISSAAPFPVFPDSIGLDRLKIKASFAYRLTLDSANSGK
jgi:protein TonB